MKIVDLFAGAGGLSLGFARVFPCSDFDPVEKNEDACATYSKAFGFPVEPADIAERIRFDLADIVVGGTPCQPFSGMNTLRKRRPDDPRRAHWREFMRAVEASMPRAFVVENVPRFVFTSEFDALMKAGEKAGYTMRSASLTAADFGAATIRTRLFVVGIDEDGASWIPPAPTHEKNRSVLGLSRWVSLRDRIGDLPEPGADDHAFTDSARDRRRAAMIPAGVDPFDWLRANAPEMIPPVYTKPDKKKWLATGYRGWDWDEPAGSLVSQFFDHAKGQLHPSKKRALTIREAARIQGFPDRWKFFGNRRSAAMQIANAVPVELAEAVARSVRDACF